MWSAGIKQQARGDSAQRPLGLQMSSKVQRSTLGFTIVELLIVVVVIAILAAITIVAYSGITAQARDSSLKVDLTSGAKQLHLAKVEDGSFPVNKPGYLGSDIQYSQTNGGQGFCITSSKDGKAFSMTHTTNPTEGTCAGHTVVGGGSGGGSGGEIAANSPIQDVTSTQCQALPVFTGSNSSAIRTVTDSRGGITQTYEIAKLADDNCWMLTNLKLGSEVSAITLTPADSNVGSNFTLPQLYGGTDSAQRDYDSPKTYGPVTGDTGSGATNYGYLYNWPAATAGESRTTHDRTKGNAPHSICPAGWRLPSGGDASSDFSQLDIAFGGMGEYVWEGQPNIARWQYTGPFKGVFSGNWWEGFGIQGVYGFLWSRSANPVYSNSAFYANFVASGVGPGGSGNARDYGLAVRCLLN